MIKTMLGFAAFEVTSDRARSAVRSLSMGIIRLISFSGLSLMAVWLQIVLFECRQCFPVRLGELG